GTVKGYKADGKTYTPFTDFAGLWQHAKEHGDKFPYHIPDSWERAKSSLNMKTPLNFVSDADIIGGNSGSPVINKAGEVVGLIFDGNIQSLPGDFYFGALFYFALPLTRHSRFTRMLPHRLDCRALLAT